MPDKFSYNGMYQNYGAFFETRGAGVTGPVKLERQKNGINVDLSSGQWKYQVGFFKHSGVKIVFLIFSNPIRIIQIAYTAIAI